MLRVGTGLLILSVIGSWLTAPIGDAAEIRPSAPTTTAEDARFVADFDRDGLRDLAIAVPGETVGAVVNAGAVQVLYGSANGLTAAGSQLWSQDTPGIFEEAEFGDGFGHSLAVADFDGDGFSDLAVGVPGEGSPAIARAGGVHIIYGSINGLTATGSQFWNQNSPGIFGESEDTELFGWSLAAGNFGKSTHADLAVGVPLEGSPTVLYAGGVHVLYGSTNGLTATGSQYWNENSPGIFGTSEPDDKIGWSLAAANFGRSTHADLVVGEPYEGPGLTHGAGGVLVIYGSANGLTATGNQFWSQNSPGIFGEFERDDSFGWSLAAGNLGRSTHADLAVGVPGEGQGSAPSTSRAGGVHVLYGSANGLTATGSQFWSQNSTGIFGEPEYPDQFGQSLAVANLGKSTHADLAVGVPGEGSPTVTRTGGVHVLFGTANGLTATGSQFWNQNSTGIFGESESDDQFGQSLAAANFGRSTHADLAVGVPGEDAGDISSSGGVHVIYGSTNGPTASGSQFWSQNSPGVPGEIETSDEFGQSLAAANR